MESKKLWLKMMVMLLLFGMAVVGCEVDEVEAVVGGEGGNNGDPNMDIEGTFIMNCSWGTSCGSFVANCKQNGHIYNFANYSTDFKVTVTINGESKTMKPNPNGAPIFADLADFYNIPITPVTVKYIPSNIVRYEPGNIVRFYNK